MWLTNLNRMKKISKKTLDEISLESGIPKGTLNKLFAGQTKDPQLSTIKAIVHTLGYTLDDLSNDDFENHNNNINIRITEKYNLLDSSEQKTINDVLDALLFKHLADKPKESD